MRLLGYVSAAAFFVAGCLASGGNAGADTSLTQTKCTLDTKSQYTQATQQADLARCQLNEGISNFNAAKNAYQDEAREYVRLCTMKEDGTYPDGLQACEDQKGKVTAASDKATKIYQDLTGCTVLLKQVTDTCEKPTSEAANSLVAKYKQADSLAVQAEKDKTTGIVSGNNGNITSEFAFLNPTA